MATPDNVNKRVVIPLRNLKIAARSTDNGATLSEYYIRYRVVSEDKNSFSEWSPAYRVDVPTVTTLLNPNGGSSFTINSVYTRASSSLATINWEIPPILSTIPEYDLYIKWGAFSGGTVTFPPGAQYEYYGTVAPGRIDIVKPTAKSAFTGANFWLQRSTFPKTTTNAAKVFELTNRQF